MRVRVELEFRRLILGFVCEFVGWSFFGKSEGLFIEVIRRG